MLSRAQTFFIIYTRACAGVVSSKVLKIKSRISKVLCIFSYEKISLLLNDTLFCKRPVLIYLHARLLFMFLFSSAEFLQINF